MLLVSFKDDAALFDLYDMILTVLPAGQSLQYTRCMNEAAGSMDGWLMVMEVLRFYCPCTTTSEASTG